MACPDGCGKKIPSKLDMVQHATSAAFRAGRAALKGEKILVSPEVKEARLAICLPCEFCIAVPSKAKPGAVGHRCAKCGCWLDGEHWAKAALATEDCDVGKWPKL